jgi:tetratricopeptide (TPR) repeat protein
MSMELAQEDKAEELRRGFCADLLGYVPAREQWLAHARSAAKAGNTDESLACYLRSLKPARRALPQMQAKQAANQAYLDELRRPQPEEEIEEVFTFVVCGAPLQRVERKRNPLLAGHPRESQNAVDQHGLPGGGTTTDEVVSAAVNAWKLYWQRERDGQPEDARAALQPWLVSLASANPPSGGASAIQHRPLAIFRILAHLSIAKSYQQEGIHFRAVRAFERAEAELNDGKSFSPKELPSLYHFFSTAITYGRALSFFRKGQYEDAAKELKRLAAPATSMTPPDVRAATQSCLPQAAYRIAQCLEFQGDFDGARQQYAAVASDPAAPGDLRRRATFAPRRLKSYETDVPPLVERQQKAVYIGENRSDMGEWKYNHPGAEGFILCAMEGAFDVVGGSDIKKPRAHAGLQSLPLEYTLSTRDPAERGRRWASRLTDTSPTALWNPVLHSHTSSNWDDFGEQRPLGEGPDLVLDLTIPPGTHRLSLALINDHSYYEPSRSYTLYLADSNGRFLAGCDVEDHLCGVYKHFAVFGPQRIKVHISRDLSLNAILSGIFLDPLPSPIPVPGDLTAEPENTDRPSELARKHKAFCQSYEDAVRQLTDSPVEYARTCLSLEKLVGEAESFLETSGASPTGDAAHRTQAHAAWLRWQSVRLPGVAAREETDALQALTRHMSDAGVGKERTQELLRGLRDTFLQSGELGRSQLLEDERLRQLRSAGNQAEHTVALKEAAFFYFPCDQIYALSKFRPVVSALADEPNDAQRAKALEGLAAECREHRAWALAEMVHAEIESKVPLQCRGSGHFRHAFFALSYQGKQRETIGLLKKHLQELPNSEYDLLWRLNLVTHLLNVGEVDEAVEANRILVEKHPKHSSADNLEFLLGLALLEKKKKPEAAKERFLAVIRNSPDSYWAKCARNLLDRMERESAAKAQPK